MGRSRSLPRTENEWPHHMPHQEDLDRRVQLRGRIVDLVREMAGILTEIRGDRGPREGR